MTPDYLQTLRIVRTCPRCNTRLYHRARLYHDTKRSSQPHYRVEADCADCGHPFRPRFVRDEWNFD